MRASALKYRVLSVVASLVMLILLLMPLHAFLTIWAASIFGHYTAVRLWKEVLLLLCGIGVLYLLIADQKIRSHTLSRRLVQLILLYALVNLVWGLVSYEHHDVDLKALGYGLIVDLRFPLFFLVSWSVALRTSRLRSAWQQLILFPAVVVVVFGLLQALVLPHNFLSHFGYGPHTIAPYETINHNQHYIRIMSTLRGANPLGAYLLLPISLLAVFIFRGDRRWQYKALLAGCVLTLFFSFSRSAWVGAVLSVLVISTLSLRSALAKRRAVIGGGVVLLLAIAGLLAFHNNTHVQNILFHTQTNSAIKTTSDGAHASALKDGLRDVAHHPLGNGPGTAGPASVYNDHPARIAENFFVQVGQETGWLGLLLFLLINAGAGYLLWLRRDDPIAFALFASLIGLSFVNLLSHAWADDTLAYVWWGLAGIAMAPLDKKFAKPKRD